MNSEPEAPFTRHHTLAAVALRDFLEEHAHLLRPLLGSLWPLTPFKVEQFGPLTKYTVGEMPDGKWAMLHHLIRPDTGAPHDHPVAFTSHVLKGSYWERVYEAGQARDVLWEAGSVHEITPDYIHLITDLPQGEVWTLCLAGPVVREWRHYPEFVL